MFHSLLERLGGTDTPVEEEVRMSDEESDRGVVVRSLYNGFQVNSRQDGWRGGGNLDDAAVAAAPAAGLLDASNNRSVRTWLDRSMLEQLDGADEGVFSYSFSHTGCEMIDRAF